MTTGSTTTLQIESDDTVFRLEFFKQHDRFAHRVIKCVDASETLFLKSVEGSPDQNWPASPPFQDMSVEPINNQDAALLVGMAGACHWSMSVTNVEIDGMAGWVFDAACRVKQSRGWLGSCYEICCAGAVEVRPVERCVIASGIEDDGGAVIRVACDQDDERIPLTIQWKYAVLFPVH